MHKLALTLVALGLVAGTPSLHAQAQVKGWVDPSPKVQRGFLDEVNFETDTAVVVEGQKPSLAAVADAVVKDPTIFLVVEGWTDGRGDANHNARLSEARAKAVAEYLVALGAPGDHVLYVGQGKAGRSSTPVTNFANRKCALTLHRGSFEGEAITNMKFALVEGGLPAYGRITQNGNSFIVRLDYGKIRQDFRSEVARIVAEGNMRTDVAASQSEAFTKAAVKKIDQKIDELIQVAREREISNIHPMYRVSVGAITNGYRDDSMGATFDAAVLSSYQVGASQIGIQGETTNLRRKFQVDAAYSVRSGIFQPSVFVGYGSVQNTALKADGIVNKNGVFLGGARLGLEGDYHGVGLTYAAVNSKESGDSTTVQPTEPWGYCGIDYHYDQDALGINLTLGSAVSQPRLAAPATNPGLYNLTSKIQFSAEVSYRFVNAIYGTRGFVRLEQMPAYQVANNTKSEFRAIVGVRIQGASTAEQARWIRVPSLRQLFPF